MLRQATARMPIITDRSAMDLKYSKDWLSLFKIDDFATSRHSG